MWRSLAVAVLVSLLPGSAHAGTDPLGRTLAAAYRSEVSSVRVHLTYTPATERVRGRAVLDLRLRPGQRRALFHFNPLRTAGPAAELAMLRTVRLDGRPVGVQVVRGAPGAEPAYELRRSLAPGSAHRLVVTWVAPAPPAPAGRFFTTFDDTEGPKDETETPFPTVSSPDVLARHVVTLAVRSHSPYVVLGSGSVERLDRRTWRIDTGRAVPSSTVFFAAVPRGEFRVRRFTAGGVPVRIVTDRPASVLRAAVGTTLAAVPELRRELGPFPVPRLDVLLTRWGSGMEYYGATRTGLASLRHELGHMYFGVTAVNRTWRDTWFDEAATTWWELDGRQPPVPEGFRSTLGRGRPPAEPGFDESAYGAGARVLSAVAVRLGGADALLAFLADLHARRAFAPYPTGDVIDDLVARGLSRAELERWLLG